jgi:hypothetical protein
MNDDNSNSDITILIEPSESFGVKTVGLKFWKKEDLEKKSQEAMNNAMKTIQNMAQRVNSAIQDIDKNHKPHTAQIEFGLKFNGELDVVIAKAGVEASISVTLGWELKNNVKT